MYQNNIQRIEKVQKKFLRRLSIICGIRHSVKEYNDRLEHFKMKSLLWRRDYCGLIFLYKILNSRTECPSLLSQIQIKVPRSSARLVNYTPFVTKHTRNKYGSNAPLTYTLRKCNDIYKKHDLDIFASKISVFKRAIKSLPNF